MVIQALDTVLASPEWLPTINMLREIRFRLALFLARLPSPRSSAVAADVTSGLLTAPFICFHWHAVTVVVVL